MSDFETITVAERLHGYPGVAFGGYVAGLLAARAVAQGVRVDFRRPVPTGTPLRLAPVAGGGSELTDGDLLLAAASPAGPCGAGHPRRPHLGAGHGSGRGLPGGPAGRLGRLLRLRPGPHARHRTAAALRPGARQ